MLSQHFAEAFPTVLLVLEHVPVRCAQLIWSVFCFGYECSRTMQQVSTGAVC